VLPPFVCLDVDDRWAGIRPCQFLIMYALWNSIVERWKKAALVAGREECTSH